jgi:hypothetical protein
MLNVIMLSVANNPFVLSVVMQNVVMQNVVMQNVVVLSVVAPEILYKISSTMSYKVNKILFPNEIHNRGKFYKTNMYSTVVKCSTCNSKI